MSLRPRTRFDIERRRRRIVKTAAVMQMDPLARANFVRSLANRKAVFDYALSRRYGLQGDFMTGPDRLDRAKRYPAACSAHNNALEVNRILQQGRDVVFFFDLETFNGHKKIAS